MSIKLDLKRDRPARELSDEELRAIVLDAQEVLAELPPETSDW
jgi:hypothetical protein